MAPASRSGGGGRRLNETLQVNWNEPPSSLYDVEVVIVYRDGSRETVEEEYLTIVPSGVKVEGFPLEAGERVLQAEVDYNETTGPFEKLFDFLRNLDEEYRKTQEEYEDWREERKD